VRVIRVPDTKANKPLDLPMTDVVYSILSARRAIGDTTYVFPANSKSSHVEEPKFALGEVAAACGDEQQSKVTPSVAALLDEEIDVTTI